MCACDHLSVLRRENADDARFCANCGDSLVSRVGVQERRIVTALFADLARSTSLGEKLDPEVVRGIVGQFFELATSEIEARGGTVEKFSGDAVMAVFGIPQAHEDDPERAVRAALAIRDGSTRSRDATSARHHVQARIGIESGEVVVGDPFGGATMATGDAMNVAARLEQAGRTRRDRGRGERLRAGARPGRRRAAGRARLCAATRQRVTGWRVSVDLQPRSAGRAASPASKRHSRAATKSWSCS